ncbi:MAG: hypothetical protein LBT68_00415, partial [Spirochaetales bacterium]|nr:hypothetical protein [Spirochaetales bacterium]
MKSPRVFIIPCIFLFLFFSCDIDINPPLSPFIEENLEAANDNNGGGGGGITGVSVSPSAITVLPGS